MNKLIKFLKDVRQEMKFINWPTKADLKEGTTVVVVMGAITSMFLWIVDSAFSVILKYVIFRG